MSIDSPLQKHSKISEDSAIVLQNYSDILTECFPQKDNQLLCFFYKFKHSPLFGILLPIDYTGCEELIKLPEINIDIESQSILRRFQHEMWSDLFRSPKEPIGRVSEANYFIVPIVSNEIDWSVITRATSGPLMKLSEYISSGRKSLILKSSHRNGALCKYLAETSDKTSGSEFLELIYGKDCGKLKDLQSKYSEYDPMDIIFDEAFTHCSAKELRGLVLSGTIKEFNENSQLILTKQMKSIRTCITDEQTEKTLSVLPISLFEVFYLTAEHIEQAQVILKTLIELEMFSYVIEFQHKLSSSLSPSIIKPALYSCKSHSAFNSDNLEVLGSYIFKLIPALAYIEVKKLLTIEDFQRFSAGFLRSHKAVANDLDLRRYIKTCVIKVNSFRPAFYASKESINDCYSVEHEVEERMYERFLKVLVAGCCVLDGMQATVRLMRELNLIEDKSVNALSKMIDDSCLGILCDRKHLVLLESQTKISELVKILEKDSIENILDYEFYNKSLLNESKILKNRQDSEKFHLLKRIGKILIDFTIAINLYLTEPTESFFFCFILSELTSLANLSKLVLHTSLFTHTLSAESIQSLEIFLKDNSWDSSILSGTSFKDYPEFLSDSFYCSASAVMLDCKNLSTFCNTFGYFFEQSVWVMVINKDRLRKRLMVKVNETVKKSNRIQLREKESLGIILIQVFIDNEFVLERSGDNLKATKIEAAIAAYQYIYLINI